VWAYDSGFKDSEHDSFRQYGPKCIPIMLGEVYFTGEDALKKIRALPDGEKIIDKILSTHSPS
jgi:hypothetical protein